MGISIGTVLLAVLPALATGLCMLGLYKMRIEEQREIEKRQRQVEVKSEPLIELRNQIANMASYMEICLRIEQVKETIRIHGGAPTEEINNSIKLVTSNTKFLAEVGNFLKALYQVDDEEITREAEQTMDKIINACCKNPSELMAEQFKEPQQAVLHIQSLINERLGEIGRKNGVSKQ